MKLYNVRKRTATVSHAGILEKLEILRSTLRWASKLERPEIQKLLDQSNRLREDILQLSHQERFLEAAQKQQTAQPNTEAERRQALIDRSFVFEGVFGENPKLLAALEIAEKAAPTDLPVLIDGESGTGKELMARVIHANGSRSDKPLISVNCGAIPESLIESELFGHKKGAFTGATSDRKGLFESAHEGTIFLDEIGELPMQSQVKLLRVLQSNEIQRVGSDQRSIVDTRVVAATNRNLRKQSEEGTFREDLYYRLSVIQVTVPPLRERKDEIPLLQEYFCSEAAERLNRSPIQFNKDLQRFLNSYNYPGNIRELRNLIYRLTCLAEQEADIHHLPDELIPKTRMHMPTIDPVLQATDMALSDVKKAASDAAEKQFLERGLKSVNGRVVELAKQIEMNRSHLQTLLKKHGIKSKDFKRRTETADSKTPA